jgi:hypothetical protein
MICRWFPIDVLPCLLAPPAVYPLSEAAEASSWNGHTKPCGVPRVRAARGSLQRRDELLGRGHVALRRPQCCRAPLNLPTIDATTESRLPFPRLCGPASSPFLHFRESRAASVPSPNLLAGSPVQVRRSPLDESLRSGLHIFPYLRDFAVLSRPRIARMARSHDGFAGSTSRACAGSSTTVTKWRTNWVATGLEAMAPECFGASEGKAPC